MTNLKNAWPDTSEGELKKIAARFYHFLTDLMVETIWCFSLSEKRIRKRLRISNPQLLDQYYDQGKGVILIVGHYGSWEMLLSSLNLFVKHQVSTIYIPLSNKTFDKFFYQMRVVFGSEMIRKKDFAVHMQESHEELKAIIFGADQSPSISKHLYWTNFLNQDTAVALGAEKYAKKYDLPVIFTHFTQDRRGYYTASFELITDTPQQEKDDAITERHVRLMEQQILQEPSHWLWSHKRWKKKRQ